MNADVLVVGAGFAGLYAQHKLRELGLSVRGYEAGADVGGTWYWNRYPGARCDVESIDYSYSFSDELQKEWDWSERYATQPEILRYLNHVADRFDLRRDISFGTRVTSAVYDDDAQHWEVRADNGDVVTATYCVFATGSLSASRIPDIPGLSEFTGRWFHTARWPHEGVEFTGRRVGIIGTGSSGIQATPLIAEQAAHLYVFQRSANYSIPAGNHPHTDETRAAYKATYEQRRRASRESGGGSPHEAHPRRTLEVSEEERNAAYERRWELGGVLFSKTFPDQMATEEANAPARAFWERKIRALVTEPAVADLLVPTDPAIGTKRICTDSDYYPTFNRDDVTLVDIRSAPIEEITPTGLRTTGGEYELDDIVFATGFDAMTGALLGMDIRGRGGWSLRDAWAAGPRTYLGLMTAGFPNIFIVTGPGSPSVLANMVLAAEHHIDWIADCLVHLARTGNATIEADAQAQDAWVRRSNELAENTLFPKANSWYLGANVPGKPGVFMPFIGGFGTYRTICADVVAKGYEGFVLTPLAERRRTPA
ncbi:flavin-containing monooxygenase [Pseudonocardia nigra]|uniref:flavin-containing monooxygenase n=1 Tax=Pseudonocardia nigra TaxID=1921578 RepID=UPI001C5E6ADB|nr:NAD(P)/FAD-dependent oxidoreductase [Pseudonocardia nigra]